MRKLIFAVLKTGTSSLVSLVLNLVSVKVIAVMLGTSGVGLYSMIRQTVLTMAVIGLGGQTSLVQGIASKSGVDRDNFIRTVFWLFLLGGLFSILTIEVFATDIASLLFGNRAGDLTSLIRWLALPVFLSIMYTYLKGVMNGFREIGRLALVEALGPLVVLSLVYPVCSMVDKGYLLAFVWMMSASQFLMLLSGLLICSKQRLLIPIFQFPSIDKGNSQHFFKIAGTTFITGLMGMVSILAVRSIVTREAGLHEAGLFDLAWSLSGNYVMLLLSSFGTYYMPTLSAANDDADRSVLIGQVVKFSVLLMVPLIAAVVLMKPLLVVLFYSKEFLPSLELVRWMLIGDYLKVTSWVLAIPVLARLDMKTYFYTESFWYIGFVVLSAVSILGYGDLQGIGGAFIALYLCLAAYYARYVQKLYVHCIDAKLLMIWLTGLLIVLAVSWQNWEVTAVNWRSCIFWLVGCCAFLWFSFDKKDKSKVLAIVRNRLRKEDASTSHTNVKLDGTPLVLCVGAQKAATTTLYALMKMHSEVGVSKHKETGFFYRDEQSAKDYDWYLAEYFEKDNKLKVMFDADPNYMFVPSALERIHKCNPSAKIIIMLRDPVTRAYSHYRMMHEAGYEYLDCYEACHLESQRLARHEIAFEAFSYISRGLYAKQIERVFELFPRNQILFVIFENFIENQQEELDKILKWMGVSEMEVAGNVKVLSIIHFRRMKFNNLLGRKRIRRLLWKYRMENSKGIRNLLTVLGIGKTNRPQISREMSNGELANLSKMFESDIQRVEQLTGLNLARWKKYGK